MKTLSAAAALLIAASFTAQAAELPSSDEVKRVLDYYYADGVGAPILVDFKLCGDVYREGDEKYNCKDEISTSELETGRSVYAWMNFMVPRNEKGEVLLQLKHDGVIRDTRKAAVEGAIRYRTWRRIALNRSGEWQLPILYDNHDVVQEIDTVTLTVNDPIVTQYFEELPSEPLRP